MTELNWTFFPSSFSHYHVILLLPLYANTSHLAQASLLLLVKSCLVLSSSLQPQGLFSPWNSPGQNTGMGSHSLLQGTFPTQGLNPGLPHYRQILYQLSHEGSPHFTYKWAVMEDQGLRHSSSSFLFLSKREKGKEHSHTEVSVTRVNPTILDVMPLGNRSKGEWLRAMCCLGQDSGSQHLGAESGNLHSSPIYTVHWQQKPEQEALVCSLSLCL